MGKRGPKPKPSYLRLLEGNPSGRPINFDEPICEAPPCKPAVVKADALASAEWDRLIRAMPPGLYTALHNPVLAMHALAWSMLVKAQAAIDEHGLTMITERGRVSNPAVKVWKLASDTLLKTADRLGLHPGARINLPKRSETPFGGKFAGLLGKTQN